MFLGVLEANQQLQFYASYHDIWVRYYPITQGLTVFAKKNHTHQTNKPYINSLKREKKKSFYNGKMINRKKYPFLEVKIV